MYQNLTFQNILDDLPVRESRKNVFRTFVEPITTRIAEIERSVPIQSSDIEGFTEQRRGVFQSWQNWNPKDEHRKEVYKRLFWLMSAKITEWENIILAQGHPSISITKSENPCQRN